MGRVVHLSAYKARPADAALDEIIGDEFVARRAMRRGEFDDGLTIPMDIHSPHPHTEMRAPSSLARRAASGFNPSPQSRRPRLQFVDLTDAFEDCLAIASIAIVLLAVMVLLP